jgi:CHAD domain-containing protein
MAKLRGREKAGKAFRKVAGACVGQIGEHAAGAARRDAEALHKMRVGVRRLRSVLTTFKPALVTGRVAALRDELRWLQGVLGRCRDWDVFNVKNAFPLRDRLAEDRRIARFGVLCAQAREDAYDDLDRVVAGRRYRALLDELQALLGDGAAVATPAGGQKLRKFSARRLKKRRKKLRVSADDLARMPLGELHELRKQVKKLRYASDFFADLYPRKRLGHLQDQLSTVQDLIGHMVDGRAGQALLDQLEPTRREDKQAVAAARLMVMGWMSANASDCRPRLSQVWHHYRSLRPLG